MPYDTELRNQTEKSALAVFKRVLKGKGRLQGVFFAASSASEASLVANPFIKDKKGTRTLSSGKAMKKGMAATNIMRGRLEFDSGKLIFNVLSKKGSALNIKKALIKDLTKRSGQGPGHDPATAKALLTLIKKIKIVDASGADEAVPDEDAGEALTPEQVRALGIDPDEEAELSTLEAHFGARMGEMSAALDAIFRDDDTDSDKTDEMLNQAALAELTELKAKLSSYASMSPENKEAILDEVDAQIDTIRSAATGRNPFPDQLGAVIPATDAILVEVANATEAFLVGDRTMGMETEYTKASVVNNKVYGSPCPTCGAKANKPCDRSDDTLPTQGVYHVARAALGELPDHTHVFTLVRNSDSKVLCEWDFETQGNGARYYGTLEAVTKPWTLKPPKGATASEARAHQQLVSDIVECIDLVQSKRKSWMTTSAVVSAVQSALKNTSAVTFSAVGGLPSELRFRANPGRAPQITFSTSLASFQETCDQGFPTGLHHDSRLEANNFQLKTAALDGDDLYNAIVEAIEDDAPSVHKVALDEGKIGPKLRGFGTVLAAWLNAIALGLVAEFKNPEKENSWFKGKLMPHPSQIAPRGPTESDKDYQARLEAAAKEKTWYWMKDQFAIMPKVPMAILAQDGGLRKEELAAIKEYVHPFFDVCEAVVKRYGLTLSAEPSNDGTTIEDYLVGVLTGRPSPPADSAPDREKDRYKKKLDEWIENSSSDWANNTGAAEGHEILHRDADGSLRMVTEVRMCVGTPTSRDLVTRMAQRMAEVDQDVMDGALADVFI